MRTVLPLIPLFLSACIDSTLTARNSEPGVEIVAPLDGSRLGEGAETAIVASVQDGETPELSQLAYYWTSDVLGLLDVETTFLDAATVQIQYPFPMGPNTLQLVVTDPGGASGSDTVAFDVDPNPAPSAVFLQPSANEEYARGVTIPVQVEVTDDENVDSVQLAWSGSAASFAAWPAQPAIDGSVSVDLTGLSAGDWTLAVTATDAHARSGSAAVTFRVAEAAPGDDDLDNDGFSSGSSTADDCDDSRADVYPGALEICNGRDDDCDGSIDEGAADAPLWHPDLDGDGFGDPDSAVRACSAPENTVSNNDDCDDSLARVHPGAPEHCDGVDEDCDRSVDEDAVDPTWWFADTDADTYGDPDAATRACKPPEGTVADDGDCDDENAAVHPEADEVCNGADDDCDRSIDEGLSAPGTWYADNDGDSYGDPAAPLVGCDIPEGAVDRAGDCNDRDEGIHPGAEETCDRVDEDCDGAIDEGFTLAGPWYRDLDGDAFGDGSTPIYACTRPPDVVDDESDCDDDDAEVYPGADEYCNGVDDDCDSTIDDNTVDPPTWYADADDDGYGDAATTIAECEPGDGWVDNSDDCDDSNPLIQECAPPRVYTFPSLAAGGSSPNWQMFGAFCRAIQYVYPGAGSGLPTTPISIHEVRFRRALGEASSTEPKTLTDVEVWIGVASGTEFAITTSFSGMIRGTPRRIHSGSVYLAPQSADVLAYDGWVIDVDPPFYYNPTSGPLSLDFRIPSAAGWYGPNTIPLDCRNDGWVQMRMNGETGTPASSNNATGCGYSFQIMGY
jgi:hypothetical protein